MIVHTVTYFLMGITAMFTMDYAALLASPVMSEYMRPIDDPLVRVSTLFQPIRGALFGLVFYALRESILVRKDGWKISWLMLVVVGILSTFGPTPGSIEGLIYTQIPLWAQLKGMPEVTIQALLLAYLSHAWITRPELKWLPRVLVAMFVLIFTIIIAGNIFIA